MIDCAAPASGFPNLPFVSSEKATSKRAPNAYATPNWDPYQLVAEVSGTRGRTMTNDMKMSVPKTAISIKTARF